MFKVLLTTFKDPIGVCEECGVLITESWYERHKAIAHPVQPQPAKAEGEWLVPSPLGQFFEPSSLFLLELERDYIAKRLKVIIDKYLGGEALSRELSRELHSLFRVAGLKS